MQQPLHSSCYCHSNGLFIEFGCPTEFYCIQNRVVWPWERPSGPCLVLAIAHHLVLLNQIQVLLSCCFYFLVLLLGLTGCLLTVSQLVGCVTACTVFILLLGLTSCLLAVSQLVGCVTACIVFILLLAILS